MTRYRRILEYVSSHPWAITRSKLDGMLELLALRVEGGRLADDEIATRIAAARAEQGRRQAESFVGVIPIYGVIMPRANLMTEMSGGTTVEGIRADLRSALADEEVSRIVFDIDSPGGSVEGIPELAAEIFAARGRKPMTAIANYTMASAAYWLGAQADEIVASPSAIVGSIGVYGVHNDQSGFNEQIGIRPTYVYAGKYKVEGNPDQPLSEEALGHIQESVDYSYDQFVRAIADARGASQKAVRDGYGEGRALDPAPAQAAGLVDRISTLEEVLSSKPPRMRARRQEAAEAGGMRLVAEESTSEGAGTIEVDDELDDAGEAAADLFGFERERRERLGLRPA